MVAHVTSKGSWRFQDCMADAIRFVYPLSRYASEEEDVEQGTDFVFGAKDRVDYRIDFTINPGKSYTEWTNRIVRLGGVECVLGIRNRNKRGWFRHPVYVIKPCNMRGFHRFSYEVTVDEVYDLIDQIASLEEVPI